MKILIFRGKLKPNGISTSLINLLDRLDYEKHSVTLLLVKSRKYKDSGLFEKINPNVKIIVKETRPLGFLLEQLLRKTNFISLKSGLLKRYISADRKRLFNKEEYDCLIDFDGYNLYYSAMLLSMRGQHSIWLHNDMYPEYKTRSPWLFRNFKAYSEFDHIISCGKSVSRENIKNLSTKYDIPKGKFTYVPNIHEVSKILKGSEEKCILSLPDNAIKFITVGRCSIEKNHKALTEAFARLIKSGKEAILVILGNGPLFDEEKKLAEKLGVSDRVIMPGNVANPYPIMKKCDCFILPSLHEGRPMVIGEARVLGIPVIMSDFATADDCMIENGQIMTGHDADSLFSAMNAFMEGGKIADYVFDAEKENEESIRMFYEAIYD